ncbi:endolytic transglycosylase MltG [Cytobacillus dafuensis]|uniref:Endolytic murein transglycosylase n=1 Tax=Cytobacillus dafuensis TaxID=1742359 RepID=A0A5B8Z6H4_CYTDA|nr:endolytic transglycosylase MltG [Cytobacillus dafuensis]QED48732.1 endolytic transglycosylase MltG [Cytobacillus dafuensis]
MSIEDKKAKKELIRQKMLERQSEARVVRKIVFIIAIILFIVGGVVAGGGYFYIKSAVQPKDPDNKKEKQVEIPIGSSTTSIGKILEDNGIIKDAKVFKYYVKFKNETGFMAGEYTFSPSMTMPEIIDSLKTGKVVDQVVFKMTIPEGKQLEQIADIIGEKTNKKGEDVFKMLNDKAFIESMMEKYPDLLTEEILNENIKYPLEGYLFPATYSFYKENPTVEEIVTVMLDKTSEVLKDYRPELEEKGWTVHQLMTMASLIEEEATEQVDRDQIASVFYNRIEAGMPLQTDPTVLYAQGEHKSKVLYKDLEIDSPYNTYKNVGLTPGPIANAGTTSIEAALAPAETDYLYFLATSTGEVLFSKTLQEHNQKKEKYITNTN